jgi:mRNA-degrading endonuclease toxin of MazEF toxin-antitoxin module
MLILQSDGPEIIAVPVTALFQLPNTLMDQIRTVDRSRLGRYVRSINSTKMNEVEQALHACLGLYYEGRATA